MKNTLQLRSKLVLGNLLSLAVSGLCGWSIWFSFGPEQLWLAIVISAGVCFLISMWLNSNVER